MRGGSLPEDLVTKAWLEVWKPEGPEPIPLGSGRVTVGTRLDNTICLSWDTTVSRVHAGLESTGVGWILSDLGSRNGTFVNGDRLVGERRLRHGDKLRIGAVQIVFRSDEPLEGVTVTDVAEAPPQMTRREREILVELCRPVLAGTMFTEPASARAIADALVVTEGAVKKHLLSLYDKFSIHDERKRAALANEAIRRGAVSVADLRAAAIRDTHES